MRWMSGLLANVLGVVALLCTIQASAMPIPYRLSYFDEQLKDEKVPNFIERFLGDQGLAVVMSESVRSIDATLNGPRTGTTAAVFDSVIRAHQLVYFYDGTAVHIYRTGERLTRDYSLPAPAVERLVRAAADLRLIGVGDRYNSFQASPATGLVSIIGTPRYVERLETLLKNVQSQTTMEPITLRYFPLKYAVATDTYMNVGNREIMVPGVATLLAQVMNARTPIVTRDSQRGSRRSAARNRLTDSSLGAVEPALGAPAEDHFLTESYQSSAPEIIRSFDAQVVADSARNAVIVRDTKDRMQMYADVLKSLDVISQVVEIEATIIDINTEKAKKVGFNWRWENAGFALQFGGATLPDGYSTFQRDSLRALNGGTGFANNGLPGFVGPDRIENLPLEAGLGGGAILGRSENHRFVARINALANNGVTRVVSRPQVATLNDVEAAIESTDTVYIPVNGTYAVDLFDVAAGTLLRVTPHVINEPAGRKIRLTVNIEDGSISSTPASRASDSANLSVTSRNQINTQVIIDEGQSVLLGGLIREQAGRGNAEVPGLGKVPLIGGLFRDRSDTSSRTERLFLLTPRLQRTNQITSQSHLDNTQFDVQSVFEQKADEEKNEQSDSKSDQ
jgi:type III secretion protein C